MKILLSGAGGVGSGNLNVRNTSSKFTFFKITDKFIVGKKTLKKNYMKRLQNKSLVPMYEKSVQLDTGPDIWPFADSLCRLFGRIPDMKNTLLWSRFQVGRSRGLF